MSTLTVPVSKNDHTRGADDAALVLVEYGDYQCPFCAEAEIKVQGLLRTLQGHLKHVFRNFPLTQVHEYAFGAAAGAEAAGKQGMFWEMHDLLFQNQASLGPGSLQDLALELELDLDAFETNLADPAIKERIKHDFIGGVRSGVNGTPGLFLNGRRYDGPLEAEALLAYLEEAA
jgi:protein-disulfide isomerase